MAVVVHAACVCPTKQFMNTTSKLGVPSFTQHLYTSQASQLEHTTSHKPQERRQARTNPTAIPGPPFNPALLVSFVLAGRSTLDDRPRLKRNASKQVRKNRQQAYLFFATAPECLAVRPLLLVLPPYFKLTAACWSHQAKKTRRCGQGSGDGWAPYQGRQGGECHLHTSVPHLTGAPHNSISAQLKPHFIVNSNIL
jgi:hypothetical protein